MVKIEHYRPMDIEKQSFAIISEELKNMGKELPRQYEMIIKRVIHTTADFEYVDTLYFSEGVVPHIQQALAGGAIIVTDTNMALAGISKKKLAEIGSKAFCFMAEESVMREAGERDCTRAAICMERAAQLDKPVIFVVGNAPTALIKLSQMMEKGYRPVAIIGVPVGFVNVVASKELIIESGIPCIINRGRKGGSNVAAAICNALLTGQQ